MQYDVDELAVNLVNAWDMTSDVQRLRGSLWYPAAHDFAYVIGHGNVRMGAGLLAALSANKRWNENRRLAVNASMGVFSGHVGDALRKARRIYDGEDPELVLPMGKKTGHFFRNILDPEDSSWVTVDRHAIRVATCDWDNGSPHMPVSQYGTFVLANQKAAANAGVPAPAFQAGCWVWARELKFDIAA